MHLAVQPALMCRCVWVLFDYTGNITGTGTVPVMAMRFGLKAIYHITEARFAIKGTQF
jgi:hypothetical protein